MSAGKLRRIRLPNEFVLGALTPWITDSTLPLGRTLASLVSGPLKDPEMDDLISQNKAWRRIFSGWFMESFDPISRYADSERMEKALQFLAERVEAWCCVTGNASGRQHEKLARAIKGSLNVDTIVRQLSDQALEELTARYGPTRLYRTISGLDSHYRRLRMKLQKVSEATVFLQATWEKSPWRTHQLEALGRLLSKEGLVVQI